MKPGDILHTPPRNPLVSERAGNVEWAPDGVTTSDGKPIVDGSFEKLPIFA